MICERPDIHKDYDDGGDYQIKPAALSLKENIPPLSSLSLSAVCRRRGEARRSGDFISFSDQEK